MASPQLEHGYTRVANEILEALVAHELTARELRVAIHLLRWSFGFGRTEFALSVRDLEEELGLNWETARRTLGLLCARKIIRVIQPSNFGSPGVYRFEKDWERWEVRKSGKIGSEIQERRQNSRRSLPVKMGGPHKMTGTPQNDREGTPQNDREGSPRKRSKQRPAIVDPMRDSARLKKGKEKSKEIYPVAPQSFPQDPPAPSGDTPEPPGTGGVKKSKRTKAEFPALVVASIETLDAFLGPLSPELRTRLGNRLLQAIGEHGEADVALALRESIRETIFKRANEAKPPNYPASMAVRYLAAHLAPLRAHKKRQLAEIRKRGLVAGLERAGRFRWATPAGWRQPPELADDVFIRSSALSRYISTRIDWIEDLARQAGLPEGGAGPGPSSIDLTGIGRDLNDLEGP